VACHQPIQSTDVGSHLIPVTATVGQQPCGMGSSASEEPTPTLFAIIKRDQIDHEGFMVGTMNPVSWGSVPRSRPALASGRRNWTTASSVIMNPSWWEP